MTVILDPDCGFEELIAELAAKFRENARFWGNIQMALMLEGRELTSKEEFQIVNTITENSGVEILCLIDHDANRIERCEKALNQKLMELSARTGQFYRGNLHRGEALESEASIVVIGDVQHGARVTAKGNIIILGELRGTVHAGFPEPGKRLWLPWKWRLFRSRLLILVCIMAIRAENWGAVR